MQKPIQCRLGPRLAFLVIASLLASLDAIDSVDHEVRGIIKCPGGGFPAPTAAPSVFVIELEAPQTVDFRLRVDDGAVSNASLSVYPVASVSSAARGKRGSEEEHRGELSRP
eukprot:scaffold5292_cov286-Pinguiococcus_pyrenoidosus.AAC.1